MLSGRICDDAAVRLSDVLAVEQRSDRSLEQDAVLLSVVLLERRLREKGRSCCSEAIELKRRIEVRRNVDVASLDG